MSPCIRWQIRSGPNSAITRLPVVSGMVNSNREGMGPNLHRQDGDGQLALRSLWDYCRTATAFSFFYHWMCSWVEGKQMSVFVYEFKMILITAERYVRSESAMTALRHFPRELSFSFSLSISSEKLQGVRRKNNSALRLFYSRKFNAVSMLCLYFFSGTSRKLILMFSFRKPNYLITAPRVFRVGSTEKLSVSLLDTSETWKVEVELFSKRYGRRLSHASGLFQATDKNGMLELMVSEWAGSHWTENGLKIKLVFGCHWMQNSCHSCTERLCWQFDFLFHDIVDSQKCCGWW